MANIQLRIDDEEKAEIQEVLDSMGLSLSGAIKLFLRKTVAEKRIPFEISATHIHHKSKVDPISSSEKITLSESESETPQSWGSFQSHKIE